MSSNSWKFSWLSFPSYSCHLEYTSVPKYLFLSFLDCFMLTNMEKIKYGQAKVHLASLISMITGFIQIGALWLLNSSVRLNLSYFKVRLDWVNALVLTLLIKDLYLHKANSCFNAPRQMSCNSKLQVYMK